MALDESVGDVTETASMIGTVYCCQEHLDKQTTPYKTRVFSFRGVGRHILLPLDGAKPVVSPC